MANRIHRQPNRGISAFNMPKFYNDPAYHRWTNPGLEFTVHHHRLSLLTWISPSSLLFNFQHDLVTTCASWSSRSANFSLSLLLVPFGAHSPFFYSSYYFLLRPLQRSSSSQPLRKIYIHPTEFG